MVRYYFFLIMILFRVELSSQNPDIRLLRAVNSPESLPSDGFFRFMSDSHAFIIVGIPVSLVAAGSMNHDEELKNKAYEMIAACAINLGITAALKYSVNRERPFITYTDIVKKSRAGSPSFPSGHTSASFELATSLSLTFHKWYIIAPSYIWAGTIGYSRMHLGVHYPSDVLAGALLGSGSAWLTHIINKRLSATSKNKQTIH